MVHQWATAKSAIERDTQGHDHTSGSRDLVLATGPLEALGPFGICSGGSKRRKKAEWKKAKERRGKRGYRSTEAQTQRGSRTPAHSRPVCPTAPQWADMCVCICESAYECEDILMELRFGLREWLDSSTHRWLSVTLPQGTNKPHWQDLRKV